MQNAKLKVEGMSCGHCVRSIETAVGQVGASAKVDLAGKSVSVDYDETMVTLDKIKEAIEDQGYDVV